MIGKKVYYKNNIYVVLNLTKVKHPDKDYWFDAYLYQSESDKNLYVREKIDFELKFKLME